MKYFLLITLPFLFLSFRGNSQTYHLSISSEPYQDLLGGIALIDSVWDDPGFIVPLGFNFDYFGKVTTALYSPEVFTGGILSTNVDASALDLIFAFSADLIDRGYDIGTIMSPISYKTQGAAGNRITTVEFKNAGFYSGITEGGVSVDYINFQLRIYEASGDLDVHIGPYSTANPDLDFDAAAGPTIGLLQGLDFNNLVINGEVELLDGPPLNPDITSGVDSYVTWPIPENTVYRFSKGSTAVHDVSNVASKPYFYPNPTSGSVGLYPELSEKITSDVSVINAMGSVVKLDDKPEVINFDGLPAGIYTLRFQTDSGLMTQRISLVR